MMIQWPKVEELTRMLFYRLADALTVLAALPADDPDRTLFFFRFDPRAWFIRAANLDRALLIAATQWGQRAEEVWEIKAGINPRWLELLERWYGDDAHCGDERIGWTILSEIAVLHQSDYRIAPLTTDEVWTYAGEMRGDFLHFFLLVQSRDDRPQSSMNGRILAALLT
jgi:hypothetical protein